MKEMRAGYRDEFKVIRDESKQIREDIKAINSRIDQFHMDQIMHMVAELRK